MIRRSGMYLTLVASAVMLPWAPVSVADDGWWNLDGFTYGGFLRPEVAIKTTSTENPYNQRGNPFNDKSVDRLGILGPDSVTRSVPTADNDFNMTMLRGELEIGFKLSSSLAFKGRLRGVFDVDEYENYEMSEVPNSMPVGTLQQRPNFYEYRVNSKGELQSRSTPMALELASDQYMVDLPDFYLDYSRGPLQVRVGNQQIAWGQSLFFRVMDVPNGLDLRRHSLLDYVPEEFSDKRVPSPGVRVSYMFSTWEVDGFVQHFRPTIYANPNTPYNVIASQFTVHDLYGDVDKEANYGFRMRGPLGPVTVQFMAARRYGHEGTFRWTRSGVNRDLGLVPGSGVLMQDTAFEVDPTGVNSADEWFHYAGLARLDAIEGLNAAINEFPVVSDPGGFNTPPVNNEAEARGTLDTFFQLSGSGLRGHIAREYHRENVFGTGIAYTFGGAPGSILDQLIANIEIQYADDRTFTNPTLSRDYIVDDEWTASLVLEKYQRFSYQVPATYFVLQWMHKTESDLFGRYLDGMGGDIDNSALDTDSPSSANYVALAVQQPLPNLVWRFDLAALYDVEGGLLLQPAARWKPGGPWAFEFFYNLLDGDMRGKNPNYNALSTVDFADEFTVRASYQF